jgi:hypothetical protein
VTKLTTEIGMKAFGNPDEVGAAAVDYLRVAGHLVFGLLLCPHGPGRAAQAAEGNRPVLPAKLQTARFYFAKLLPETATPDAHRPRRQQGADGYRRRHWPEIDMKPKETPMNKALAAIIFVVTSGPFMGADDARRPVAQRRRQDQARPRPRSASKTMVRVAC